MGEIALIIWGALAGFWIRDLIASKAPDTVEHTIGRKLIEQLRRGHGQMRFAPDCKWTTELTLVDHGREAKVIVQVLGANYPTTTAEGD